MTDKLRGRSKRRRAGDLPEYVLCLCVSAQYDGRTAGYIEIFCYLEDPHGM
jgi:hypothetical protein